MRGLLKMKRKAISFITILAMCFGIYSGIATAFDENDTSELTVGQRSWLYGLDGL
jgi:hypothetical protein